MAVWQYKFALVPRRGVIRYHGIIPDELPGYRAVWNPGEQLNETFPNYWDAEISPETLAGEIEELLPVAPSWAEELLIFRAKGSHRFEIRKKEDLNFHFSLREPDLNLLESVVELARRHDLLVVPSTYGRPMEPSMGGIIADIKESDAYKFCKDPRGFLQSLKGRGEDREGDAREIGSRTC